MEQLFTYLKSIDIDGITDLAREYYIRLEDFVLDMTFDLAHDFLFLTVHFPIFFILQSIWICIIVRNNQPKLDWWQSLLISFSLSSLGRVLVALFTNRRPPLLENPYYTPFFVLIWFCINSFPFDIFYRVCNSGFFFFLLQLCQSLIQIRESSHGIDIGLRAFPSSIVGSVAISLVLSSVDSFIWLLFFSQTRDWSVRSILKNLAFASCYLALTQYPEYFSDYVDTTREGVKIYGWGIFSIISLIDNIIFGLKTPKGIDFTFLTYIAKIFKYRGNQSISKGKHAKSD